jgi:hypothetical protein
VEPIGFEDSAIPLKLIAAPAGSYSARTISFASRLSSRVMINYLSC